MQKVHICTSHHIYLPCWRCFWGFARQAVHWYWAKTRSLCPMSRKESTSWATWGGCEGRLSKYIDSWRIWAKEIAHIKLSSLLTTRMTKYCSPIDRIRTGFGCEPIRCADCRFRIELPRNMGIQICFHAYYSHRNYSMVSTVFDEFG